MPHFRYRFAGEDLSAFSHRKKSPLEGRVHSRKTISKIAHTWRDTFKKHSFEGDVRSYALTMDEAFRMSASDYPSIAVNPDVMLGAPCIAGTRIPVYMVLHAVQQSGELEGAIRSYPRLTLEQVKEAISFAGAVMECSLADEAPSAS